MTINTTTEKVRKYLTMYHKQGGASEKELSAVLSVERKEVQKAIEEMKDDLVKKGHFWRLKKVTRSQNEWGLGKQGKHLELINWIK